MCSEGFLDKEHVINPGPGAALQYKAILEKTLNPSLQVRSPSAVLKACF